MTTHSVYVYVASDDQATVAKAATAFFNVATGLALDGVEVRFVMGPDGDDYSELEDDETADDAA